MKPQIGTSLGVGNIASHRFTHEAMATIYEVIVAHDNGRYARQAADAAFDLTDALDGELSRFIANSDVSRISALTVGQSTRVGEATMDCLLVAQHIYRLTEGAFDVSLGAGLLSLELLPDTCEVQAPKGGVRLDLGGIGKGYAVDRMAALLEEWDLHHALVHGGASSVLAMEPPPGEEGWPLTLSLPDGPILHRVSARHLALGAAGVRKGDHIVDPRSGLPVSGRKAAWVALETESSRGEGLYPTAIADALSTAFMLLPQDEIARLCALHPGLRAWIVDDTGLVRTFGEEQTAAPEIEGNLTSGRGPLDAPGDTSHSETY